MKFLLKSFAVVLFAGLKTICFIADIFHKVSAYIMSPVLLFVLGCCIYSLVNSQWLDVALLIGIELFFIVAMFASMWLTIQIDCFCNKITKFIRS